MMTGTNRAGWTTTAILAGRLIFAATFIMAGKLQADGYRRNGGADCFGGFPLAQASGSAGGATRTDTDPGLSDRRLFSEIALAAAAYVLFLAFAFDGSSHWATNQAEFGFFVDHFTFIAGLLFAAAHCPGQVLAIKRGWLDPVTTGAAAT